MEWLRWSLMVAAALHIFEEFAYPGGFVPWYRRYLPDNAARLTRGYLIGINALLVYGCFGAGYLGFTNRGIALWLTMASFVFFNALFHIAGAITTQSYSPGIVTAIALYMPLSILGYVKFVGTGKASAGTAFVAVLIGTTHTVSAYASHYLRRGRTA
jgi:hypothetical protein